MEAPRVASIGAQIGRQRSFARLRRFLRRRRPRRRRRKIRHTPLSLQPQVHRRSLSRTRPRFRLHTSHVMFRDEGQRQSRYPENARRPRQRLRHRLRRRTRTTATHRCPRRPHRVLRRRQIPRRNAHGSAISRIKRTAQRSFRNFALQHRIGSRIGSFTRRGGTPHATRRPTASRIHPRQSRRPRWRPPQNRHRLTRTQIRSGLVRSPPPLSATQKLPNQSAGRESAPTSAHKS